MEQEHTYNVPTRLGLGTGNSGSVNSSGGCSGVCARHRLWIRISSMYLASFPGRAGEGKTAWYCLRMRGCPTICGGQDLYVYSPCNVGRYITCTLPHIVSRFNTIKMAECVSSFDQGLTLALQRVGEGRLTLKEEQMSAIRHVLHML